MTPNGPFWIDRTDLPARTNIRFVLIGTTEPGNIGSSARAIKTMGFSRLVLVSPPDGWRTHHAIAMAHGAEDILESAEVCDTLDEALAGCGCVVATTRRSRRYQSKTVTPREWGEKLSQIPPDEQVAILFGPEKTGMTNKDILRCRLVITVPTPVEHPSLNLSQAVMLMAYECGLVMREPATSVGSPHLAVEEDVDRMYNNMEDALRTSELPEKRVRSVIRHLRVILHRAQIYRDDVNTFHTITSRIRGPRPRVK